MGPRGAPFEAASRPHDPSYRHFKGGSLLWTGAERRQELRELLEPRNSIEGVRRGVGRQRRRRTAQALEPAAIQRSFEIGYARGRACRCPTLARRPAEP